MPARSKKLHASESTGQQVLDLSPDALRNLTEKIESTLKKPGEAANLKDVPVRSKAPSVKRKSGEHSSKTPVSTSVIKAVSNGSTAIVKQKPTVALKTSQGKKRLRDGRVKEESYGRKGHDVNNIKLGSKDRKPALGKGTKFDEEVRALGGTKEDVDLVAEVVSESEMEDEEVGLGQKLRSDLEKETLQLVRQLGVDRMGSGELMAGSESEEADGVNEQEDDEDPGMGLSSKVTHGVKPALQTATSVGQGQRSMVRKQKCSFFDIHADFEFSRPSSLGQSGMMPGCYTYCLFRLRRPLSYLLIY